jgi:hypothetical protein
MKILAAIPFIDGLIKSNGFAVVVMFGMMTAMAYTLWNQYNKTNERLSVVEQQVLRMLPRKHEKDQRVNRAEYNRIRKGR